MGNIMEGTHGHGEASRTGQPGGGVHGVLHRLKPLDLARLTHMEHEYRSALLAAPLHTPAEHHCSRPQSLCKTGCWNACMLTKLYESV